MNLRRLVTLVAMMFLVTAAWSAADGWQTSWDSARATAKRRSLPLIAVFVKDGCPQCETMLNNTKNKNVRAALKSAVKVQLEVAENRDLAARYGVQGTPTLFLFAADTGYDEYIYCEVGAMSESSLVTLGETVNSMTQSAKPQKKTSSKRQPKAQPKAAEIQAQCTPVPAQAAPMGNQYLAGQTYFFGN